MIYSWILLSASTASSDIFVFRRKAPVALKPPFSLHVTEPTGRVTITPYCRRSDGAISSFGTNELVSVTILLCDLAGASTYRSNALKTIAVGADLDPDAHAQQYRLSDCRAAHHCRRDSGLRDGLVVFMGAVASAPTVIMVAQIFYIEVGAVAPVFATLSRKNGSKASPR